MSVYVICHGAWSGGWAWKKMRPLLWAAGHEVMTSTYTGLGERAHLAHPMVDLETHIQDVRAVIEYEGCQDVILVGHSYGGMVATGVADRHPDLVRHLVYLDAFVPSNGQSLNDLTGGHEAIQSMAGSCRRGRWPPTPRRTISLAASSPAPPPIRALL